MNDLSRDLVTEGQLARLLKTSPRTLRRWRQLGDGPPWSQVGRKVFYLLPKVRKWLEAQA